MYPVHVDKINHGKKKMQNPPGPGVYELPRTFGKEGLQRSFGKKLHLDDI